MLTYLSKLLVLLIFGLFIIYNYYFNFNHIENFDGYAIYIFILAITYVIYKVFQVNDGLSENKQFSLPEIGGYFAGHLLLLSCLFFYYNFNQNITTPQPDFFSGFAMFFRIIIYLILPIILIVTSISFSKKILSYIHGFTNENKIFQFVLNLSFGFYCLVSLITIIGFLGFYNVYSVVGVVLFMLSISYRQVRQVGQGFLDYRITISSKEGYGIKLITSEFLFIIATLLISVNLINVLRPFPIGWDDLGVYMNGPSLLAQAGEIFQVSNMFSWQIFTGIGYIFNSPTQAFFLNNVGGILSFIVMILVFSDLFKSKSKKHFLPIPLLLATIFISMPMFIFEQAKDMKLDPGFYFISISIFYITLQLFLSKNNNTLKNKVFKYLGLGNINIGSRYIYFFLVGLLLGFAFSIKFTALLLIAGLLGLLFYVKMGLSGLLGYVSLFFAIFTKFGLWKMMNVSYPYDDIALVNNFSLITGVVGLALISHTFIKNKKIVKVFMIKIVSILIGIFLALLPWLIFNLSSADTINLSGALSGKSESLQVDYTKIYSQDELNTINEKKSQNLLSADGTTGDEDIGRYFGYEKGINNYLKLPWNLTMQVNQKGEFTDITYIYLALLPLLLLFLPFRNKYAALGIVAIFIFEILLFNIPYTEQLLSNFFSQFTFPGGYGILLTGFIIPLIYLLKTLKDTGKNKLIKYNLVFAFFYTFLWTIAAYGIVWYGIVMYFNFLLLIGGGIYYLGSYDDKSDSKTKQSKLLGSVIVFTLISIYFFASTIPHAFKNLKTATYKEFKDNQFTSIEAPFLYHSDYVKILFELNISDDRKKNFINESVSDDIKNLIIAINKSNKDNQVDGKYNIIDIYDIEELISTLRNLRKNIKFKKYHNNISDSLLNLYAGIYHPADKNKNKKSIYRIGTFLKYYISENNNRLLDDPLLTNFDQYLLSDTPDETVENMKKLGLDYFLVDLNAATIDNDPRRNLTKRYESLLKVFTSDKLELVSTDSMCFKVAREGYEKSDKTEKDLKEYLLLAGVNYDSLDGEAKVISRGSKRIDCFKAIIYIIETGKVVDGNYKYLVPFKNYFIQNEEVAQDKNKVIQFLHKNVNKGYKILYKINE